MHIVVQFEKISEVLYEKRTEMGLSQLKVSRMLGLKSPQYLSNIERNLCSPSMETLVKLQKIYKIPRQTLLTLLMSEAQRWTKESFEACEKELRKRA